MAQGRNDLTQLQLPAIGLTNVTTTSDSPTGTDGTTRSRVFHSWSAQRTLEPLPIVRGEGATFWDDKGRSYLDFASQLVYLNMGHQHPRIVAAIAEQASELCTIAPSFENSTRSKLASMLAELAPGDLNNVFFTNGGADANEHAIRMARLHTGRNKVLAHYRSYHGATGGAISLTGDPRRWPSEPAIPGVVHFFGPYLYRSPFHATTEAEECARALQHLEEVLMLEGVGNVAAIVLESIVGTNGILVPPDGYLAGIRALCDQHGIVLICDEVMSGFGRAGEWFAVDRWGVMPDLITFAKGVNSGYVPLGGVIISDRIAASFADRAYPGGLTYSGHPLACAAGVATIEAMHDEAVVERSRRLGDEIVGPTLAAMAERHPSVGEVRGTGLFWGIELVRHRQTREMLVPFNAAGADNLPMAQLAAACRAGGVWPFTHFNRLHVVPPLVIEEEQLRAGLAVIDEALEVADKYVTS